MNTLSLITNSVIQQINEQTIDDLLNMGFSHERAVKLVTEFDEFYLVQDSIDNPVENF